MNALNILSKHHKEWLNIVRLFGNDESAEDIVHDVYLKIHEYNYYQKILTDVDTTSKHNVQGKQNCI
jgi:DNA-directed RNA polymerase specialized sigma24 family protein